MMMMMLLACTAKQTFPSSGLEREYVLHVPDDLPDQAPLVFFLHGYRGGARSYSWLGMKAQADALGFAVVFPQGTRDRDGVTHWNAQLDISSTDDFAFLTGLAAALQEEHGLDPQRTYAAGISNGGFMSYALVCHAPEVFHAAGSVIGTMSSETWESCPAAPVPIFQVSGTDDEVVPIDGSMSVSGGWGGAPPMSAVIAHWADVNGCTDTEPIDVGDEDTTSVRHTRCASGDAVVYHEVAGMGHALPRWDWAGELSRFLVGLP